MTIRFTFFRAVLNRAKAYRMARRRAFRYAIAFQNSDPLFRVLFVFLTTLLACMWFTLILAVILFHPH